MSAGLMERIRQELSRGMPRAVVSAWFSDALIVSCEDQVLALCSPTEYKRDYIRARYIPQLEDAMLAIFGVPYEIRLVDGVPQPAGPEEKDSPGAQPDEPGRGCRDFIFDRFIVGESNKYAYSAAQAVAESPGEAYNPLFLYGGSGLGKTHLLYAIQNKLRQIHPGHSILYFSAEQFTNDLVAALKEKSTDKFRGRYRSADLLLVDDIQFIAGRDFSQEEFFHTFNALYEEGRQIVLTSDRRPRDLQRFEERLLTRFEWGLIVDVKPPDFETRIAIVQDKAQRLGIPILPEVAEYIAQAITSNVRQLEGAVKKLMASRDLMASSLDLNTAQEVVADMIRQSPGLNPTPQLILGEVCSFYKLDERQITGKGRQADLVTARQTAMYLIRDMTSLSLEQIGDKLFSRDHSTVVHSVQRVEDRRKEDPAYDNDIKTIIENIRGV
ncbi:MAG: chromosomal replication initiator protein DnaA [Oscillospiraceae bacterium]|jgi:chromosomal replication initiator protein|nr:chromosomal replication initiator protein DnaA [Oscillospiraceae bacterium]